MGNNLKIGKTEKLKCKYCGNIFIVLACKKRKFCSQQCHYSSITGIPKDKKMVEKMRSTLKKIGHKPPKLKPGEHPWNYKGEEVGYRGIHRYISVIKGKAKKCSVCGEDKKIIDWANIDHKYSRNPNDYIALCKKCHGVYDKKNNLRKRKYE